MSAPCYAVDLVTFNVEETLLDLHPDMAEIWADALAEARCRVDQARLAVAFDAESYVATRLRETTSPVAYSVGGEAEDARRHRFVANVLRNAGVSPDDLGRGVEVVRAVLESPRTYVPYDDALPTLHELWSRGLKLGVVANTSSSMPRTLLELGFGEYLGFWVISEVVGVAKPAPEIFERALEIGATDPGRSVHVGNNVERDVVGAQSVGMQAVWLDRGGRQVPRTASEVPRIRSLRELLETVG